MMVTSCLFWAMALLKIGRYYESNCFCLCISLLLTGSSAKPMEKVPLSKTLESTKIAIDTGFRHIDSAYVYPNEKEIGQAIRSKIADGVVRREDIFLTTKLWCTFHRPELVDIGLERSLKNLQLDYVDLFLIHYPMSIKPSEAMLTKDGNGKILFETVDLCATWEVECHPYLNQKKLLDFCKSRDIVLVAYGALGSQRPKAWVDQKAPFLLKDPVLCAMAKKHNRSPAQIALRYQVQRGVVALAQSYEENEMKENIQALEFQLPSEDMEVLNGLNRNFRYFPANIKKKLACRRHSKTEQSKIV
ncbi:aldo-keto reductase family 1 member C1-like isoform X5 [Meriones unguiculatus]|uniref:aldo-keto reductase family 1 member C1-like isoform X5 n=1 Tax=Meriones unguiculatus TaxID=10047 RepID=UPI00293F2FB2|nr:aldo-keto reductase family 1 member C1-like isoform X5 [Meriones unguiculatus]